MRFLRQREHLLALPEPQRVGRAGLDAGRGRDPLQEPLALHLGQRPSVAGDRDRLADAVGAVRALLDLRGERVPLRGRDVPGAREHAVAAADAFVRVVGDGAVGLAVEGRRRAGRDTGRLQAVEAPPHDEGVVESLGLLLVLRLVEGDQRVGPGAQGRRVLEAELRVQLGLLAVAVVPLLAGDLAGAAADAVGDVDERRLDRDVGLPERSCPPPFRPAPLRAAPTPSPR